MFSALARRIVGSRGASSRSRGYLIQQQLRAQLGHDLWFLGAAIFLMTMIETGQFERNTVVFSTFNIIFETVSAYSDNGISTGLFFVRCMAYR
jgi:Trk-type K+ transport system membrane component